MKNNKLWLWVLAVAMTISLLFAVFAITTHAISGGSISEYILMTVVKCSFRKLIIF